MTQPDLIRRLRSLASEPMPLPGAGSTPARHLRLMQTGREDLSLARLAEAHWDAVAILAEAERAPMRGAIYGVWASEIPGSELLLTRSGNGLALSGTKAFCSGASLLDRALVTAGGKLLLDVDLRTRRDSLRFDNSGWKTSAFRETDTAAVTFNATPCAPDSIVGAPGFYLDRPGFWHGACGPAACWAGGAEGLVDYARTQTRNDPHTRAHLGAMFASVWALRSFLDTAGREIDQSPSDVRAARIRARTLRHLVEQASTEILRRLPRAFGPHPLAMNEDVSRRCLELDLYLRQSHAERDLEALGNDVSATSDQPEL